MQSRLRTVAVREIMTADPVTVPTSATVAHFLQDLLPSLRHSAFPVVDDGQTVGLVTVRRINQVPADERDRTTLREVACPLAEVARATPDEPVADLLPRLNACSDGRGLVFADGQLAGDRPLRPISAVRWNESAVTVGRSGRPGADVGRNSTCLAARRARGGHRSRPCPSAVARLPSAPPSTSTCSAQLGS